MPNAMMAIEVMKDLKLLNERECPVLHNVEVPKVLGDILESVVGAVFLDSKMNLETVWNVYTRLFPRSEIDEVIRQKPKHPVKELMEKFPSRVVFKPAKLENDILVSRMVEITIMEEIFKFKGIGKSSKSAKYGAAKCALREFEKGQYRILR